MKKFLYSNYTKGFAILLFIACIALGAMIVINGVITVHEDEEIIYGFEESFDQSAFVSNILGSTEAIFYNAYQIFYGESSEISEDQTLNGKTFEEFLTRELRYGFHAEETNYFISVNGMIITNCGAESAEELMEAQHYRYNAIDADGTVTLLSDQSDPYHYSYLEEIGDYHNDTAVTICTSISDEYAKECEALWEKQSDAVLNAISIALCFLIAALILLVYLIITAGKTKEGEVKTQLIDGFWTEIHLAVICIPAIAAVALGIVSVEAFLYNQLPSNLLYTTVAGAAILGSTLILMSLLSLVRKLKCHIFLETSIIFKVLRWAWQRSKQLLKWLKTGGKQYKSVLTEALGRKSGRWLITMLFLYTALIGFFGVLTPGMGPFAILLGILLFGFAAFVLAHRTKDLDTIKSGAKAIRSGNLQYKIEEPRNDDLKPLAKDINDIADGLERSMEDKLKAERLKSDLITNVSHDLKTPLTSIINYTTLLSEMDDLPEEAKDYIAIIAKKSEGLKNLTRDLFEISKVQSGNETFHMEKLDAAQLIEQAMGEHNSEIERSDLTFCIKTEKDLCFMADGKKMSRVLGNLIDNALKYAMKNTRVFLETHERNDHITMEIKNTSAEPMDFDAEEITARFVRGDASRTDGGNGLGLAIAKSYTEACGGSFQIIIDGDLFKAVMTFPKH